MVKFSSSQNRLARIARQTGAETGKKIEFELTGGETEVDLSMQGRILAPIEHMLRNAISHGIEPSDERLKNGKPKDGKVSISLKRDGGDVLFEIKDDGRGLNLDAIKDKALELAIISKDQELAPSDIVHLIFYSGLSTADKVTQIEGRGVGMDVVSSEIKLLGGDISIHTEKAKGTTFTIRLPLTLAISQALLVVSGNEQYAIPIAGLVGISLVSVAELKASYTDSNKKLVYGAEEYTLQYLGTLMQSNSPELLNEKAVFPVLFLRTGNHRIALHVDTLQGRMEVVVKPVGVQISSVPGITGATIMANGDVILILDVGGLYRSFTGLEMVTSVADYKDETVEVAPETTIMIVDDSITIRKVTQRMLEGFNINVVTAKDGVEVVALLSDMKPDLMLLDIEMPRMDGFEVASFVKNTPSLNDLPIIMITSRTGEKHRKRAKELGVAKYLGKPYQEKELISSVAEILDSNELRSMINA
jgi:chemosensory pili system protein ChpA (sensor histidine kinase/response regulator)